MLHRYTKEFRQNFKIAAPVMLGYLGHVFVGLMDNVFVGKLDPINLAAVSLANASIFFIMAFGIGFSYAITPLVSEAVGANKHHRLQKVLYNGLLLNTVLGILMAVLTLFIPDILGVAHQPPEVIALAVPYVRIVGISLLFVMIFQAFKQFSDGLSLTTYPMVATLIANVVNIILSYAMVFGKLGFPEMGIYGAAYGTLIARLISVIALWYFLRFWSETAIYFKNLGKHLLAKPIIKRILYLGIPSAFQGVFEMGIFSATIWLAGTLGAINQAGNQIAQQMASMTFMVFIGFGVTATVRVGNQKGRKDFVNMKRIATSILLQVFLFELLFTFIFIVFRHQLPWIYLSDNYTDPVKLAEVKQVYEVAVQLLIVAGLFQISDGFQVVLQGALRGLQDVIYPFWITLIAYWLIGFPISWYMSKSVGVIGIWYGLLTGLSVAAIMLFFRFQYLSRKYIGQLKVESVK
jgi:MATE family multidrug resistance protein